MYIIIHVYTCTYVHVIHSFIASPILQNATTTCLRLPPCDTLLTAQGRTVLKSSNFTTSGFALYSITPCNSTVHSIQHCVIQLVFMCMCTGLGSGYQSFRVLPDSLHVYVDSYEPTSPLGVVKVHVHVRIYTYMYILTYLCSIPCAIIGFTKTDTVTWNTT